MANPRPGTVKRDDFPEKADWMHAITEQLLAVIITDS